ncbi:MAG: DUF2298 domain-containing protein, partial [Lachnospiraceae bacterium]
LISKSIGIMLVGWIMFVLSSAHLLKFMQATCIVLILVVLGLNVALFIFGKKKELLKGADYKLIIIEEVAFLLLFLLWVYIIGFKPEAYGTEKFMDYAFITSMMRTTYLPPIDPWFSGEAINYYYGGQYLTAFIIKTSGVTAGEGYTLMRAAIASFSCMLPFSVVYQLLRSRFAAKTKLVPYIGGAIGGIAVAFCGNFQYVIYGLFKPIIAKMYGEDYSYWFPDATRFIGYNPDMPDKTIHEFPAYSTVLGDLHAHYINIVFVVVVTAAALAYALRLHAEMNGLAVKAAGAVYSPKTKKNKKPQKASDASLANAGEGAEAQKKTNAGFGAFVKKWLPVVLCPEIILIGFYTGIFRWTNFWDFPIYFVVGGSVVFFMNLRKYWKKSPLTFLLVMGAQAIAAAVIGVVAALPFTLGFDQISSEVLPTHSHTMLWQLLVLWGLPCAVLVVLIVKLFLDRRAFLRANAAHPAEQTTVDGGNKMNAAQADGKSKASGKKKKGISFRMDPSDLVALLFGLCAFGLVLLPEVIYVV